ncbi:MAG: PAS domain-containing sensor histidine kinase, partial [Salinibacter sp.]
TPQRRDGELVFNGVLLDITQRKEAELELERQNDLFAKAQDLANVGGWEYDVPADEYTWTDQVYRIYGLPDSFDPTVQEGIAHYHPDDRPMIRKVFTRAVEEGEPYDVELRLIDDDGNQRWVRTRGVPQRAHGEVVRVRGSIQDITDRKGRERRLEAIFNHTYQFTGLMTPDGTLIEANDTALEFGGVTEDAVLGTPIWDTDWFQMGNDTKERLQTSVQRAADGEFVRYEVEVQGAEDTRIIDFSIRPVTNEEGDVVLLIPEGRDITERKQKEQDLAHQKALLEAQAEATIDGLLAVDGDRNVAFYNEQFLDIWEVPEEAVEQDPIGKPLDHLLLDYVTDLLEDPEGFREKVEYLYDHPDEESRDLVQLADSRWLDRYSAPIVGDEGAHFGRLWVFRDVTEREEREERLREAKEEAEEASRLKSAMLANMSHEIRTPLTSITGFAELLTDELEGKPAAFSERIYRSGQRLMKTLDSVLELSKLEAGAYEIEPEPVRLDRVAEEAVTLLRPQAKERNVDLEASGADQPVEGYWNEGALNRIAENLIENAIKFTPEGGQVTVRVGETEGEAYLAVEDTGVGISEEALLEIFEAFKQESEGLGREYEGTGLGLSIVKELTDRLGGEIEVESEKGEGTCFTVRLPKAKQSG